MDWYQQLRVWIGTRKGRRKGARWKVPVVRNSISLPIQKARKSSCLSCGALFSHGHGVRRRSQFSIFHRMFFIHGCENNTRTGQGVRGVVVVVQRNMQAIANHIERVLPHFPGASGDLYRADKWILWRVNPSCPVAGVEDFAIESGIVGNKMWGI